MPAWVLLALASFKFLGINQTMSQNLTLSIVMPTLNRPEMVKECLESIRQQTFAPTEFIMVDQSDNEKSKKVFEAMDLGRTRKNYVFQKTKSLIKARNNGLDRASDTDLLMFLEDDSVLFADYFEKLVGHFHRDQAKRFGGGMGTNADAVYRHDPLARIFKLPHDGEGRFLASGAPTFPYWKKDFCEVEFLSGGNSMFRTHIIKKFRYDERLIGYGHGDDVDVSYRISRHYKMFYEPAAKYHHESHPAGKDLARVHRKNQLQNFYYLVQKNMGSNWKTRGTFSLYFIGQCLDDVRYRRKGALLGDAMALFNILRDDLDSVDGYREFKESLSQNP
jgi:glucosyl-dolichyl phosphate glucuronosyltransferase